MVRFESRLILEPLTQSGCVMHVMLLAAGLATRLRPLSLVRPKLLTPVLDTPMLDYWRRRLAALECRALVINAFHLADRVQAAVADRSWTFPVTVSIEPQLLGTGGGLRRALTFLGDGPLVAVNGDILCNVDLPALLRSHLESRAPVSLLVHDCPPFNNVAVDPDQRIIAFGDAAVRLAAVRRELRLLAFTGVQVIESRVLMPYSPERFLDVLAVYRDLIGRGQPPRAVFQSRLFWREMGSLTAYFRLNRELAEADGAPVPELPCGARRRLNPTSRVEAGAELRGMVVLGRGTEVGADAVLDNVIAWDGVRIAAGSRIRDCILADGTAVGGALCRQVRIGNGEWASLNP